MSEVKGKERREGRESTEDKDGQLKILKMIENGKGKKRRRALVRNETDVCAIVVKPPKPCQQEAAEATQGQMEGQEPQGPRGTGMG